MSNYDVFISYSRRDDVEGSVSRLKAALEAEGLTVWMDDKIVSSSEWWGQIQRHIERSNNFLLLISEHSLSSEWCQKEIGHALSFGKRIIPFQLSHIDERRVKGGWLDQPWEQIARKNWERLRDVQWITDYVDAPDFDATVARISADAKTDPKHVEAHTRLLLQAQVWQNGGQSPGAYISGEPLAEAEAWLAAWDALPDKDKTLPAPTEMQRVFIATCRSAQDEAARLKAEQEARTHALEEQTQRAAAENERLGRRTARFRVAALAAAMIGLAALVATIVALGQTNAALGAEAGANTQVALASTREFGANGTAIAAEGRADTAEQREANANAGLTAVPPTLTHAADQVQMAEVQITQANSTVVAVSTEIGRAQSTATQIPPTLTRAAVVNAVVAGFTNILLQQPDNPNAQLTAMDELVTRYPDEPASHSARGSLNLVQKNLDAAIADYTQAIILDPNYALAYNNRGIAYANQGDLNAAITDYTQAINLDPNYANAYYNRGNAYADQGNLDAAIADYSQAITFDHNYALAYNNRGIAYYARGDLEAAIADYSQAITYGPTYALSYNNRGIAYANQGNLEAAIADFTQTIALDPSLALAYNNRGVIYRDQGNLDAAIADFTQAISLDPNYALAYTNRGNAHHLRGQQQTDSEVRSEDLRQAVADWRQAEALGRQLPESIQNAITEIESELGITSTPSA